MKTFRPIPLVILLATSTCFAQGGPSSVIVAPVERRPIELTQPLVASVEPVTRTRLAAEQEGIVIERRFDEGQPIEKDSMLVRVNDDLLQLQRRAAEASRQVLEAQLQRARAEAENARSELRRISQLHQSRVGSVKEYEDAVMRNDVAAANVVASAAQLLEKTAEVERMDLMIRKAQTKSPLSGVVSRRYVEVGQWVRQGDPVADLVQLDPLHVRVNVPESVMPRLRVGDEARITIDALGRNALTGKVEQILPEADPQSRTFQVKLLLPNPDLSIRPGFFARAVLVSQSESSSFIVPKDAVVTQGRDSHVVAARQGMAVIVPVTLGPARNETIAVTGDLQEQDQVVIRGNELLRDGEPLMIQER